MGIVTRPTRDPRLVGLVSRLWSAPAIPGLAVRHERILPTARAQVIVSDGPNGSVLVGPKAGYADMGRDVGSMAIGAVLEPGSLPALIGASADEVLDHTIALDTVWNVRDPVDELLSQPHDALFDRFETILVARLRLRRVDPAILAGARMLHEGAAPGDLAGLLGRDRRRFVPEFRRSVGVGPKRFQRVDRVMRTVARLRRHQPASMALLAAESGFADQAHLTREVSQFCGVTPATLRGDATSSPNHLDSASIDATKSSRRRR